MDFEQNNGIEHSESLQPPQPPVQVPPVYQQPPAPKKKSGWRIFWGLWLGLSVLANIVFFLMIIGLFGMLVTGSTDMITEKTVMGGERTQKIAVINIVGIIDSMTAADVTEQIKHAAKDKYVKAIILSVDSPGGTISGSDQIYNEILKYRNMNGKPVVAFMHNLAASGGYYVSVAAEEIVAEPTVITGSIGVIMATWFSTNCWRKSLALLRSLLKAARRRTGQALFTNRTKSS